MKEVNVTLRFDDFSTRDKYVLRRLEGTATPGSMIRLITNGDLKANPREAKVGDITEAIEETLSKTPELFPFKSKGILLAAGGCIPRDRNRFELAFQDEDVQGILDGGHNLLAIALHIIREALGKEESDKVLKKAKRWDDVAVIWAQNLDKINGTKSKLNFLVPVEVVYPHVSAQGEEEFFNAILAVAKARNNNAELTEETKANKAGYYDALRGFLDPKLTDQIEWKTNDGGRIKVRDMVALSWVALSKLKGNGEDLPGVEEFDPVSIYNSKGSCVAALNDLMESDKVTAKSKGEIRELIHPGVKSALSLMREIPRLYDLIYTEFPGAYSSASPGGFGKIGSVYMWNPAKKNSKESKFLRKPPHTKFYQTQCDYDYPDGFIVPLVWALSELMEYKHGKVSWRVTSPERFVRQNLPETLKVYQGMISLADYDPQKVGKTSSIYTLAANEFRTRVQ
jgi:hypothetical protein